MSAKKRKIGQYYLKVGDKGIKEKHYPSSAIVGLLEYIITVPKVDRKELISDQNKFYFLDSISSKPPIINLIFKIAKTHHSPNIISEITVEERPNSKQPHEGDAEKTHLVLKCIDGSDNIALLFEERQSGVGIARSINYLNRFAEEMYKKNHEQDNNSETPMYDIEYYAVPSKEFIESIAKFGKITVARLSFDKNLLANQSEFLASTNREKTVNKEVELIIKSERFETILPSYVKGYYSKHMLEENKIKRIRLGGKNVQGNPLRIDTDKMRECEYIEINLEEKTGVVDSTSIFSKLNDMIKHMN